MCQWGVLLLLILCVSNIYCARILAVFPIPSISHQIVFRPIINELLRLNHELVVITPDPQYPEGKAPLNLTEIDVHDISYNTWKELIDRSDDAENSWVDKAWFILNLVAKTFEEQMNSKNVQDIVKQKSRFDLLLVEACVRMTLGLSHVFKVPVIQISSLGSVVRNYEAVGAPSHPLLYPTVFRQRIYNLTIWEKIFELYHEFQYYNYMQSIEIQENAIMKRLFGPDTPTLNELYKKVELLLLNVHSIWENNRPVSPNIIFLGGLHQNVQKDLPQDLLTYLDSSKNGVIYVSFGTNVRPSLFTLDKIKIITNVFSELPYDILFKWDKDELPGQPKNVKISKWFPQSDLLRHPKIKLFITQGGLQSTDEAITAGVPLVGIPIFADQWYNVEKYEYFKIGLGLNMKSLNEDNFKYAIQTVIEDESFRRHIAQLRRVMNDQREKPLERAVWWIEHVLRHGGAGHLRSPAANVSWVEYFELELVMSVIFTVLFFVIFVLLYQFRICNVNVIN